MKIKKILAALTAVSIVFAACLTNNAFAVSVPEENSGSSPSVYDKVAPESTDYTSEETEPVTEPDQEYTDPTEDVTEQTTEEPEESSSDGEATEETAEETEEPSSDAEEVTEEPSTDAAEEPTEDTTENPTEDIDQYEETRLALLEKVEEAKNISMDDYTEETFKKLETSLFEAEAILSDWVNRYKESPAALANLEESLNDLESYIALLEKTVERGEAILPDWYTDASFALLQEALEEGRAALDSGTLDSSAAKSLIAKIEEAIDGLYNLKDKLIESINEAKKKYDLLYEESSLNDFKAEISRIEGEITDNITPDEVKKLIDDVLNAYSLLKCVLGDVNLSGSITIQDSTALQRYLAGLDLKIEPGLSDVNFDGVISVADATRIQQYVAKIIDEFEKEPQLPEYDKDWNLVLVNYKYPMKSGYVPSLRMVDKRPSFTFDTRAADALEKMLADCRAEGLSPLICSAYRTQSTQEKLFNNKVQSYLSKGYSYDKAVELAKTSVAYPGTSEHQLGLAVDIVSLYYQILDEGQLNTKEQQWLMKNCWKYGFILRYPDNKSDITGVIFEPWHYRYVGAEAAKEIMEKGITLEEYLGFV